MHELIRIQFIFTSLVLNIVWEKRFVLSINLNRQGRNGPVLLPSQAFVPYGLTLYLNRLQFNLDRSKTGQDKKTKQTKNRLKCFCNRVIIYLLNSFFFRREQRQPEKQMIRAPRSTIRQYVVILGSGASLEIAEICDLSSRWPGVLRSCRSAISRVSREQIVSAADHHFLDRNRNTTNTAVRS